MRFFLSLFHYQYVFKSLSQLDSNKCDFYTKVRMYDAQFEQYSASLVDIKFAYFVWLIFFLMMMMMVYTIIGRTGSEPPQRKLNNAIPICWPNKTENRKIANRLNIHCVVQLIRCAEVRFHCENVFSERHFPPIGLAGYMYGTHIYTNNRFQYSMEHTYTCVHSFAANISTSSSRYKNKRF